MGQGLSVDLSGIVDLNGTTDIATRQLHYRWQRFAANGTTLEEEGAGHLPTYFISDRDVGKTIKVQVSFTDDDGYPEGPLSSAATPVIAASREPVRPLVGNTGRSQYFLRPATHNYELSQSFTTGGSPRGYALTSIQVRLEPQEGTETPTVKLMRGSFPLLTDEVATFTGPRRLSGGELDHTFTPAREVALDNWTTYTLVVSGGTATWRQTSDGREYPRAEGWSIANDSGCRTPGSRYFNVDRGQSHKASDLRLPHQSSPHHGAQRVPGASGADRGPDRHHRPAGRDQHRQYRHLQVAAVRRHG